MEIRIDYNNMMQAALGEKGISDVEIEAYAKRAKAAFDAVINNRGKGMQGWMELMYNQSDIVREINECALNIRENFDNFVVLGIGGSALGPIAVFQALKHPYFNELTASKRNAPRFYVLDNVDPERMNALFDIIDVKRTMFNVISKSGATSETMSQYLIVDNLLREKLGKEAHRHIIATTDKSKGNLIKLAHTNEYKTFYIPDGVGGRFSEICPVGLLPAAVLGIDIAKLLEGCAKMDKRCSSFDLRHNPALITAVLQSIAMDKGRNISVMMPYADSLKYIADWYCQLWGESLGKAVDKNNNVVNRGQTPTKSLGVTDQHSQIQLYTEGPFDKVITFIEVERFRSKLEIPVRCEDFPDVNFLCGHDMGELLNTELKATKYSLCKAQKMNYSIILPEVNENTLGQLLYLFMMQTAYCGELLEIDTYNQPGVEEGKNATYALFGRKGYETKREELSNAKAPSKEYTA
ncbi:MAG: glucose-6-phosphate isomerase [Clostridia bacterium]|nr:glucose-6-phosphate isomerase [Clostridia bacterium]